MNISVGLRVTILLVTQLVVGIALEEDPCCLCEHCGDIAKNKEEALVVVKGDAVTCFTLFLNLQLDSTDRTNCSDFQSLHRSSCCDARSPIPVLEIYHEEEDVYELFVPDSYFEEAAEPFYERSLPSPGRHLWRWVSMPNWLPKKSRPSSPITAPTGSPVVTGTSSMSMNGNADSWSSMFEGAKGAKDGKGSGKKDPKKGSDEPSSTSNDSDETSNTSVDEEDTTDSKDSDSTGKTSTFGKVTSFLVSTWDNIKPTKGEDAASEDTTPKSAPVATFNMATSGLFQTASETAKEATKEAVETISESPAVDNIVDKAVEVVVTSPVVTNLVENVVETVSDSPVLSEVVDSVTSPSEPSYTGSGCCLCSGCVEPLSGSQGVVVSHETYTFTGSCRVLNVDIRQKLLKTDQMCNPTRSAFRSKCCEYHKTASSANNGMGSWSVGDEQLGDGN